MASTTAEHWDSIYASTAEERLGWFERSPDVSLSLISRCGLGPDDPILDVGAGASRLVDELFAQGHRRVIATDISATGLAVAKARLGEERARAVEWIVDDVTRPTRLRDLRDVALWHDRAVLHFLLGEEERAAYVETVRTVLRPGGYAIVAAFSLEGAEVCSGLEVRRYDEGMLAEVLGEEFRLLESVRHVHRNPADDSRPYAYARFQRTSATGP